MLRQGVRSKFGWTAKEEEAFQKAKGLIQSCTNLAIFDLILHVRVTTDASSYDLEGLLHQQETQGIRTVAFVSRMLSEAERRYLVGEREAFACLRACEKWSVFHMGRLFILRTDHQALVTLLSTQGSGRKPMCIARWAVTFFQFNYEMQYTKGQENVIVDVLYRLPVKVPNTTEVKKEKEIICTL